MAQSRVAGCLRGVVVAACVTVFVPAHAWAWGCGGHRTVARIAARHLSPHARQQVLALLIGNPIDPGLKRFCQPVDPVAFVDAATWADDVRDQRPQTAEWHFLDIPRGATRDKTAAACPTAGCVTTAIAKQLAILRSNAPDAKRAEALRYVIHFVGDLHQPLHCITNDDRGGNCVPVQYFDAHPELQTGSNGKPSKGKFKPNLHGVWDTNIIAADLKARHMKLAQLAEDLDQRFSAQIPKWMAGTMRLHDWAWDSHELAETPAYGKLPVAVPVETDTHPASCDQANRVAERMLALGIHLDQPYQDVAAPDVHEQLAKAGARLAKMLNRVWP